ncbi:hypothetical protein ElP_75860 (plasmid) [Tautonia plasticadhaerens]|uniref:Uncharacterized protein n=1 Tax=Tautonia plasticadhaerens TaxID=2527974 RepID=A0A518HFK0_9BACT|nr:hypothetical protein ElP_75860 [Tautonia plasticadhaerens]
MDAQYRPRGPLPAKYARPGRRTGPVDEVRSAGQVRGRPPAPRSRGSGTAGAPRPSLVGRPGGSPRPLDLAVRLGGPAGCLATVVGSPNRRPSFGHRVGLRCPVSGPDCRRSRRPRPSLGATGGPGFGVEKYERPRISSNLRLTEAGRVASNRGSASPGFPGRWRPGLQRGRRPATRTPSSVTKSPAAPNEREGAVPRPCGTLAAGTPGGSRRPGATRLTRERPC